MHIYPTLYFEESFHSILPMAFALGVFLAFVVMIGVFLMYDGTVRQRNTLIVANAARSNAVLSSLFPGQIRDRVVYGGKAAGKDGSLASPLMAHWSNDLSTEPLADLFLETTVLVCTILLMLSLRLLTKSNLLSTSLRISWDLQLGALSGSQLMSFACSKHYTVPSTRLLCDVECSRSRPLVIVSHRRQVVVRRYYWTLNLSASFTRLCRRCWSP